MTEPRTIATVTTYPGLMAAFRARATELQASGATLDDVADLPARYVAKLLAPRPVRRVGMISLGSLLNALGLALAVVEDPAAMARYGGLLDKRNESVVRGGVITLEFSRRHMKKIGKKGGLNGSAKMSKAALRRRAKRANLIRWEAVKAAVKRDA